MDCSPPGSSVHEASQARILEWVAFYLLQGIFPTQGLNSCLLLTRISCVGRQILHHCTTWEALTNRAWVIYSRTEALKQTRASGVFCAVHFPSVSMCWHVHLVACQLELTLLSASLGPLVSPLTSTWAILPACDQAVKPCSSLAWIYSFLLWCKVDWSHVRSSQGFQGERWRKPNKGLLTAREIK